MTLSETDATSGKAPFWRAQVTDYGRVKAADIEMAPLVLLVGRNNTGKSYIASLLWALLNFDDVFLGARDSIELLPAWFMDIASGEHREDASELVVTPQMVDDWFADMLRTRLSGTVERLLSLGSANIGGLTLTSAAIARPCRLRRKPLAAAAGYSAMWGPERGSDGHSTGFDFEIGSDETILLRSLFISLLSSILNISPKGGLGTQAVYVPAARTGLMLALGPLTASTYETLGIDVAEESTRLPLPTIRFLQTLTRGSRHTVETGYEQVADFLEGAILNGKIVRDQSTSPSFSYQTTNDTSLPLHAASSMVTELAPLLILLRNARFDRGLVFEEPEAHLHLSAQRAIARAIARLVNLGVPVVVTTHSDTFLQELNILMQLHAHPERDRLLAELGYEEADLVDAADVRGYEFCNQEDGTHVRATEIGEFGIVVPSLNETLHDLTSQLMTIQEQL